jgi:hypothetical protein
MEPPTKAPLDKSRAERLLAGAPVEDFVVAYLPVSSMLEKTR